MLYKHKIETSMGRLKNVKWNELKVGAEMDRERWYGIYIFSICS